jgi:probable F420-dependent oxidoreductase
MRLGLGVSEDVTVARQTALATDVEAAGLASLWTNEAQGRDALLLCQAWAAGTDRLDVGVGVVPLWTRSPAQLAMAAATLQEASGGRFLLGIGVSHPATMGPWHGATYERPLTAAGDLLTILAQLAAGDTSDHDGDVLASRRFRLGITPLPPPPRTYLAAMGPRMLALAGRSADGALLNWAGPEEVRRAGEAVRAAARDAGRERPEVATYVRIAVDDERDRARAALAREIGRYAALPAYASHLERQGFGHAVEAVKTAYRDGGEGAVATALDDDVLLSLGWYGTPADDPGPTLDRYRDAGLDHLVARVVVTDAAPVAAVRRTLDALRG